MSRFGFWCIYPLSLEWTAFKPGLSRITIEMHDNLALREFQYADDCALIADSEDTLHDYIDSFADAASSFGLTINCKKTEVPTLPNSAVRNPLSRNDTQLANIPSNTSAAPLQMTADWTRNSIAESQNPMCNYFFRWSMAAAGNLRPAGQIRPTKA